MQNSMGSTDNLLGATLNRMKVTYPSTFVFFPLHDANTDKLCAEALSDALLRFFLFAGHVPEPRILLYRLPLGFLRRSLFIRKIELTP
jgi:hypothetical protein